MSSALIILRILIDHLQEDAVATCALLLKVVDETLLEFRNLSMEFV